MEMVSFDKWEISPRIIAYWAAAGIALHAISSHIMIIFMKMKIGILLAASEDVG
jgi:hypothetical protein